MNNMTQEIPVQKKSNMKVIALAVVCIILAASLVGVTAVYVNNQSQITSRDKTIAALNDNITSLELDLSQAPNATIYETQIGYLEEQLSSLNENLTELSSSYSDLQQLVQLGDSGILYQDSFTQDANSTTVLFDSAIQYTGYVVIQELSSASSTYAQVIYTYGNYNFNYNQTLGTSGTALFPVLPGPLQVIIGNQNETSTNTGNATATFYY
jgi:hypothetical protein